MWLWVTAQLPWVSGPRGLGDHVRDACSRAVQPALRILRLYRCVCAHKHTTWLVYKDRCLLVIILSAIWRKVRRVWVCMCVHSLFPTGKNHHKFKIPIVLQCLLSTDLEQICILVELPVWPYFPQATWVLSSRRSLSNRVLNCSPSATHSRPGLARISSSSHSFPIFISRTLTLFPPSCSSFKSKSHRLGNQDKWK